MDAMTRTLVGIALCFALVAEPLEALAQDHSYVGIRRCRNCHRKELMGDQYGAWQKGPHAKTLETLKSAEAVEIATQKGIAAPPHEAAECLKCHVTAFGVEADRIRFALAQTDGVQCESCHGPGNDYRRNRTMADHAIVGLGRVAPGDQTGGRSYGRG